MHPFSSIVKWIFMKGLLILEIPSQVSGLDNKMKLEVRKLMKVCWLANLPALIKESRKKLNLCTRRDVLASFRLCKDSCGNILDALQLHQQPLRESVQERIAIVQPEWNERMYQLLTCFPSEKMTYAPDVVQVVSGRLAHSDPQY
jgi:hypothetical protein